MLKVFLIFWIFKNSAYASEELCIFKHQKEINNENFNILKRNIPDMEYNGIGILPNEITFKNNGQTVIVKYYFDNSKPFIIGSGPYGRDSYQLDFMYFNWLNHNRSSGKFLPFEFHVVFFNTKYNTFDQAIRKNFGITIWSFHYDGAMSSKDTFIDLFYSALQHITEPQSETMLSMKNEILPPLNVILDIEYEYYVYQGTLLPFFDFCKADVIWIEYPTTLTITPKHYEYFEQLLSFNNTPLMAQVVDFITPNGSIYQNIGRGTYHTQNRRPMTDFEYFSAIFDDGANAGTAIISIRKCLLLLKLILISFCLTMSNV